jgi:hypothetical protein
MSYAYYPVIPCGNPSAIAFISNERLAGYPGFFIRFTQGVPAEFLGICYHVDTGTTLPENVAINWLTATYEVFNTCEACATALVPPLPEYSTYQFDACCGGTPLIYSINSDTIIDGGVYSYTGPSVGPLVPGCYTLTSVNTNVPFPFVDPFDLAEINSCADPICQSYCSPCQCYAFVSKAPGGSVDALDCNGDPVTITVAPNSTSDKFCLSAILSLNGVVSISYGLCAFINGNYTCADCYTLLDCEGILDPITSTNPALAQYAGTGQSIQIEGSDTCWNVIFDDKEFCDCAINTTVQFVYQTCLECNYPQAYKITECTTGDVIYTTSDLSDYVNTGATINIDCGGCWFIEEIDGIPPSDQPVVVEASFADCQICNSQFYELIDCLGNEDSIITIADLSQYVGQTIELQFCPDICWLVTTTTPQEISGNVLVEKSHGDCSDCLVALVTPKCASFENTGSTPVQITYTNLAGTQGLRITAQPGQVIPKSCYLSWTAPGSVVVTEYGDCIDGQCPPVPSPILYRAVTPGYNTPVCSTEYYETVECAFSEWMYKDVLEKRYGISNCCPDELMKWEIKHEMLMLDILVNPNYVCQGVSGCGCNETHTPPPACNS